MKYNNSYLLKYMNYILPFNKLFLSLGESGSRIIKKLDVLKSVHWDELKKITVNTPSPVAALRYEIPSINSKVNIVTTTAVENGGIPGESMGYVVGYYFRTYDINGNQTYEEYVPDNNNTHFNMPNASNDLINAVNKALESHLPNIRLYGITINPAMNVTYEFTKDQEVYPSIIFKDIKDPATFDWTKLLLFEITDITEKTQGIISVYSPGFFDELTTIVELKQNYTMTVRNEQEATVSKSQCVNYINSLLDLLCLSLTTYQGAYITISGSLANCIKLYLDDEEGTETIPYTLFINTKNHNWETVASVILEENTTVRYSGECFGVSIETGEMRNGFAYYDGTLYEYDEFNENFSNGALDFILNECDYNDELIQASVPAELRDYIQIVLK